MADGFYLLNFTVSGVKCIKEEVRLDFYKKTVDKNFDPEKYRVKAVYGENGSGKSALITAVKIFQDLVMSTNYLMELQTQGFLNEIINKETQMFRFACEFLAGLDTEQTVFQYSFCLGKNRNNLYEIQHETLKVKNGNYANNKYRTLFECKEGELIYISCNDQAKEVIEKATMNLLSMHPFIHSYIINVEKIVVPGEDFSDQDFLFYILLSCLMLLFIRVYIPTEDQHELYFLQRQLKEEDIGYKELMDKFFAHEDRWSVYSSVNQKYVSKTKYEEYKTKVSHLAQFIKIFKPNLVSIDIDAKENGDQYVCDLNLNYGGYVINKEFESTGIKKLIRLFDCFASASLGGIVFVDEMDANLNDVYLCRLVEYFMYYGKGQLCFTTHNLDPMSVLKENRNSIDFLSSDNHLVPWTSRGNASPENCYKNGMIEDSPFNIDATDFVGIFGE